MVRSGRTAYIPAKPWHINMPPEHQGCSYPSTCVFMKLRGPKYHCPEGVAVSLCLEEIDGEGVTCHKNPGILGLVPLRRAFLNGKARLLEWQACGNFCQALTSSLIDSWTPEETFVEGEIIGSLSENTPNSKLIAFADGRGDVLPTQPSAYGHTCGPHSWASSAGRQLGQLGPKIRPLATL